MASLQQRLAKSDSVAFAELYDACADRVGHYLLVLLGGREDAEDVLQETFLRLARIRRKLAKVENLDAYVFTIARNEAARLLGKNSRRLQLEQHSLSGEDLFCVGTSSIDALENAEWAAVTLRRMDGKLREVVELKIFAGLTFQEISRVTGAPQGTVATRYRAALAKMREWTVRQS
jgi:RNA polymerase sigma-70 factor (ECF subfamily)